MKTQDNTRLARINPAWTPSREPLGILTPFFGGRGSAPAIVANVPARPAPAAELVAC